MPVSGWLVLFAPFVELVLFVAPPEDLFAAPVVPVAGVGAVSVVPLPLLLPLLFDVEVGGGAVSDIMVFFPCCPTLLSCLFKKEVRLIAPVTVPSHSCFAGVKDVEVRSRSYQDMFALFAGLQLMMRCSWIQPRSYSPHLRIPGCLLVLYLSIY